MALAVLHSISLLVVTFVSLNVVSRVAQQPMCS